MAWSRPTQSKGAAANSWVAKERFYALGRKCEECGLPIKIRDGEKPCQAKKRRFCDKQCSNTFIGKQKRKYQTPPKAICKGCGIEFERPHHIHKRGYTKRSLCNACFAITRPNDSRPIDTYRKEELRALAGSDKLKFHTLIRKRARQIIAQMDRTTCEAPGCGYGRHVEVCHIKAIRDFPDEALISDINSPDNIAVYCPTHHWEFDHGYLQAVSVSKV